MNKLKRALNNQALGILPLLLAIFLDVYFLSYIMSLIVGLAACLISIFFFLRPKKGKYFQFLLVPTLITLLLYCIFLFINLKPILYNNSPIVAETLLVVVLAFAGFTRKTVLFRVRNSTLPSYRRTMIRTTLDEAYFMGQVIQNLFTLHLFAILLYTHLPESTKNLAVENFIYKHLGLLIGLLAIIYGQLRMQVMHGALKKETWLPVLNDKGRVVGSMAHSVSRSSSQKYFHPIVRVAAIYNGMLYLTKRASDEYVSPELLDHPFHKYVIFRHSIEGTVKDAIGKLGEDKSIKPRFMIRYTFEDDKVKHLVSLYVISLRTEEQLKHLTGGKLWTSNQIQENMNSNIFSEYFEKEFPYLQNTILLAESVCCGDTPLLTSNGQLLS